MPVSDWTRTQLDRMAPDGSTSHLSIVDRPDNSLCLCTGSLGSANFILRWSAIIFVESENPQSMIRLKSKGRWEK